MYDVNRKYRLKLTSKIKCRVKPLFLMTNIIKAWLLELTQISMLFN